MNIYQIQELTKETSPHFFSKDTMKFFRQTMSGFKVEKVGERYRIYQKMRNQSGQQIGMTVRYFNPKNNELEIA
jgi:IS1 family transposase